MERGTPEQFYKEIQEIQTKFIRDTENDVTTNYQKYYNELAMIRKNIQEQMDKIIHGKPVKSQQMLQDYKDIYNTQYMTNLCLVLGMCLIIWYIVRSNSNVVSQSPTPSQMSLPPPNVSP
jgi:hypothetical protein